MNKRKASNFAASDSNKKLKEPAVEFLPVVPVRPRVFALNELESANAYLDENGYVVVKLFDSWSPKRIEVLDLLWKQIELMNPKIDRSKPETWGNANWVGAFKDGIVSDGAAGQAEACWAVRTMPEVRQVFESVWRKHLPAFDQANNRGMFVSFDGFNVMRPTAKHRDWATRGSWWHVDQSAPGFRCIQGLFNLLPCLERHSAGFSCVPGSHKDQVFENIFRRDPTLVRSDTANFILLKQKHIENSNTLRPVVILLDAAELLLWDSRTIHANDPGQPRFDPTLNRLRRAVVYVCMTPSMLIPEGAARNALIERRKKAAEQGKTTNHWPHLYQEHVPSFFQRMAIERKQWRPPAFTPPATFTNQQTALIEGI